MVFVPLIFSNSIPLQSDRKSMVAKPGNELQSLASNQWYSAIYNSFPTAPMYALPLVYKLGNSGIEISYPVIKKSKDEMSAPFSTDLIIGNGSGFQKAQIAAKGDWHIDALVTDSSNNTMTATIGHGIPYITIRSSNKNISIQLTKAFKISRDVSSDVINESSFTSDTFILSSDRAKYIVLLPHAEQIKNQNGSLSISNTDKAVIALLDNEENIPQFTDLRDIEIIDTQSYPTLQNDNLVVQYKFGTANNKTPLIALYPHQYGFIQDKHEKIGEYRSIRGPLYLYKAATFTTSTPLIIPKTSYIPVKTNSTELKKQIVMDVDEIMKKGPPSDKVYFQGTWFGKVGSLILLADSQGLQKEKQDLIKYIKPIFLKSLRDFKYDKNKTSLIANKSEFGNDNLNDHHFHYGYYIRLAAIIGSIELDFVDKTNGLIDEMVNDIATINRQDSKYPFLRNFDIYESHSWADGYGNSSLGNNQESSSEAINAWYSLYLWSNVTRNTNLNQYALYLYNAEVLGAKYYWFDTNNFYGAPYEHAIASQVWGGKISFTTWFSGETNMKYGIQLLPLTPGSEYLGTFKDFSKYESSYVESGGDTEKEWGDLFIAWQAMYDKENALDKLETVGKSEGNNPKSNLLYYLYVNN